MERNTTAEMRQVLDALERGENVQFTGDGVNWLGIDKFDKPYAPDFMHNRYRAQPKESKKGWMPFGTVDGFIRAAGGLGAIWLKSKNNKRMRLVTDVECSDRFQPIKVGSYWENFMSILENYTFANGTPWGVLIEGDA